MLLLKTLLKFLELDQIFLNGLLTARLVVLRGLTLHLAYGEVASDLSLLLLEGLYLVLQSLLVLVLLR